MFILTDVSCELRTRSCFGEKAMGEANAFPWILEFRTSRAPGTVKLHIQDRATIGIANPSLGIAPDLDLTDFGAAELGVAPEHVALYVENDHLNIVDLGSGMATLVNGTPLKANIPHPLEHGDDLQLGNLHFHVQIIASPSTGGMVYQQPSLQLADEVSPGQGQSILIVEDDPPTAELLSKVLRRRGFTTRICHEVVSAIRALSTESHSAIVLDLMLPNIHGLELCRYVRRDIRQRDIPIVVVSAATTPSSIKQAMSAGVDIFLGKPFHIDELVQKVAALVQWYEARKPTRETKRLEETETAKTLQAQADVAEGTVLLFVSGYQEPIAIVVSRRATMGRRSTDDISQPNVDLDQYGAFEAGVSRMHAAVHRQKDGFYLEDLGSSNGTWLNEEPLPPGELRLLQNASQVRLGNLRLRVYFFTEGDEEILGAQGE